jgi:hypothetical protein
VLILLPLRLVFCNFQKACPAMCKPASPATQNVDPPLKRRRTVKRPIQYSRVLVGAKLPVDDMIRLRMALAKSGEKKASFVRRAVGQLLDQEASQ